MENVMHRLFTGELAPMEEIRPNDPEYKALWTKFESAREAFKASLDETSLARFNELDALYIEESTIMEESAFTYGVRLGLALSKEL